MSDFRMGANLSETSFLESISEKKIKKTVQFICDFLIIISEIASRLN